MSSLAIPGFPKAFYDTYMLRSPRNRSVGNSTQSCGSCVLPVSDGASAECTGRRLSGLTVGSFLRMSPEAEQGGRCAGGAQEGRSHVTLVEAEPPD